MRRLLAIAVAALALAPAAGATGWYDENGYHHNDEPGDICYEHGGTSDSYTIDIGMEDLGGVTVILQQLILVCGDGHWEAVGEPTYVLAGFYDPGPPPADPGEAWQDNPCYPPERFARLR